MRIRGERGKVAELRARWAGGDTVGLNPREIHRLDAVVVAGSGYRALEAVDVERGAPVGVVAAHAVDERGKARGIELQLDEARSAPGIRAVGGIGIAVRRAGELRIGIGIADVGGEPRCDRQLE